MYSILKPISDCGLLPIVAFDKKEQAVPFVEALAEGGMPFCEVLFRTDAAADAIREVVKAYPDFLIGAGTILTIEQAQRAIDAGAKFLVMPGFDPEVAEYILAQGKPVVPGCDTPGEIQQALRRGITVQKFFPARAIGGPAALKEYVGPFRDVTFVATGSLVQDDVDAFLAVPNVAAAGGDFMFSSADIAAGNYAKIAADVKQCFEAKRKK